MTLKKYPPLKEMFAALPPDTLKSGDNVILSALSNAMKALREVQSETNVFTIEMRGVLLSRLKLSVAEVLDPHVPRQIKRPRAPLRRDIDMFEAKLGLLSIAIEESWHKPVDQRPLTEPRAALDIAYRTLLGAASELRLDVASLTDTWRRLDAGIEACATRTFSEAPTPLAKSTAAAQMRLVFKVLSRDAQGARA